MFSDKYTSPPNTGAFLNMNNYRLAGYNHIEKRDDVEYVATPFIRRKKGRLQQMYFKLSDVDGFLYSKVDCKKHGIWLEILNL